MWRIVIAVVLLMVACEQAPTATPTPETIEQVSITLQHENYDSGVAQVQVLDSSPIPFTVKTEGYYPGKDILIAESVITQTHPFIYHLDDHGNVLRAWKVTNKQGAMIGDRRFLDNGNILFVIGLDGVYEMDYDGNIVWYMFDSTITHHAEVLPNGNLLTAGAGCDCIKEIDRNTKQVMWSWNASQSFPQYDTEETYIGVSDFPGSTSIYANTDVSSPVFPFDKTHINYTQYLPETDTFIVSLRSYDLVAEINREGSVVWSFGPGVIKHQHYPKVLPDNTLLIYDNGNGRVIRVTRNHQIIWEYGGMVVPFLGDNDLLEDGNYKILQTTAFERSDNASDIRVVSPEGVILWRLIMPGIHMYRADMTDPIRR